LGNSTGACGKPETGIYFILDAAMTICSPTTWMFFIFIESKELARQPRNCAKMQRTIAYFTF
jgi:hypothetical protein